MTIYQLKRLLKVAQNKEAADLIIKNINLVNVFSRKVELVNVVIAEGIIARVDLNCNTKSTAKEVMDGTGKYLIPGLLDAHTHIEMSFMSAVPFAEAVIPHGTTGAIFDTHDMGNVSMESLRWFAEEVATTPLKAYLTINPCVPSSPSNEDGGVTMDLTKLQQAFEFPGTVGVGEVMDFNRVISGEEEIIAMLLWSKEHGKFIEGHCPELTGESLQAYAAAGITSDHESISLDEMLEKYRLGMKIIIRRGSLDEPVKAGEFLASIDDSSNVLLSTDGCIQLDTIVKKGTMIEAVRAIVSEGADPVTAVQMATINVARAYGLQNNVGVIAPGRFADMVMVDNLSDFNILGVWVNGERIPTAGKYSLPRFQYPQSVLQTIKIGHVGAETFEIPARTFESSVKVHVIGVSETSLITKDIQDTINVRDGKIFADPARDILKIAVLNRYTEEVTGTTALVKGFGFREGALAGSVAQDSQNMIVVGASDDDMAYAVNVLREIQGGVVYVNKGKIIAQVELPVGGIVNHILSPEELMAKFNTLSDCVKAAGGSFNNPAFPLAFMLTCPVIPEIKITNRGLINGFTGERISLVID